MDCIFCRIIAGEIPGKKVYEDDKVLAIYDINPQADTHILVMPKQHICCAAEIDESNADAIKAVFLAIPKIARQLGLDSYRVINNCGEGAGQSVMHIHFHLLADKRLGEKLI